MHDPYPEDAFGIIPEIMDARKAADDPVKTANPQPGKGCNPVRYGPQPRQLLLEPEGTDQDVENQKSRGIPDECDKAIESARYEEFGNEIGVNEC